MSGELRLAVDTSFVIAVLKGAIQSNHNLSEIAFPFAVVGELRFGALGGRDPQRKLGELDDLISRGTTLAADGATASLYAELRHRLKSAGTPLPENDIWIGAVCIQYGLTLLTLDRHFERIEGLRLADA